VIVELFHNKGMINAELFMEEEVKLVL